ncbi:MAG: hypothetical protein WKH64_10845 [Chloroflexia bacterium]
MAALASRTSFSASRALAENLSPLDSFEHVERALAETDEARRVIEVRPDITWAAPRRAPSVDRADRGGMLDPEEFLLIATTIAAARTIRRLITRLREAEFELPLLGTTAARMHDLPDRETTIRSAIGEQGDVLDSASPELARIRMDLRRAHERLLQLLRSILTSSTYAQAIQEPIITEREGRYVIPVKADFRSRLPGIVHDTSGSGQTLFVEPLGAVEAANRWRELQRREVDEIDRVLMELSGRVAGAAWEIRTTVAALAQIDFALAKARYANALQAVQPEVVRVGQVPRDEPLLRLRERSILSSEGALCRSRSNSEGHFACSSSRGRTLAARPSRSRLLGCSR